MTRCVVVGAGITGLTAAYRLTMLGHSVTVIEASNHIGGKIRTTPFAGIDDVEEGGDVFLARVPWALELCTELGIQDLESPAAASASVWWNGRMHAIPDGLVLGVPAGLGGLARSRLLTPAGKLRAAIEPILPRRSTSDDNIGGLLRARFGAQVAERLVDPLLGGINAGDIDHLSLAASAPQLAAAHEASRSLLLGLRRNRPTATGPVFHRPKGGLAAITNALAAHLTDIRVGTPVVSLERSGPGNTWTVTTSSGTVEADAVLLATPAYATGAIVRSLSPGVAASLQAIPYASVAMVTMAVPRSAIGRPIAGAGYLVPKPAQRTVTAVSFGTAKWPGWTQHDNVILRVSVGRYGNDAAAAPDDALLRGVLQEIRPALQLQGEPSAIRISRWPNAFPQYLPGHIQRVAALRAELAHAAPGLHLAGAAYDGIGIPACIRQGNQAARTMVTP